jgi:hypothetical protein
MGRCNLTLGETAAARSVLWEAYRIFDGANNFNVGAGSTL